MSKASIAELSNGWLALWNGDHDRVAEVVTDDFVLNVPMPDSTDITVKTGPEILVQTIRELQAPFEESTVYEIGPIVDLPYVAVRWRTNGVYRGGLPDIPPSAIGRSVHWTGIDILRVAGNRIAEAWVSADATLLMKQLA